ncbi:MAG: LysR substrate-binding domain-containing protein [Pseudomonadota bacterium]
MKPAPGPLPAVRPHPAVTDKQMRITLKQLEYFVAAGEMGSIKLAATRINISQPSISSAISHLEREFGVQLFVRHHAQGLALTSAGKTMLREAKLMLRQAQGLYTMAGELNNEMRGRLSVGCMVTLAPMIAPELAHAFSEHHPGVTLNMTDGSHQDLLDKLRKVEIDVAISYDLQIPADIQFEPLATLSPYVLVSRNHSLARRPSVDLAELATEPMVMLDLPQSREYFVSLFESKGLEPMIVARAANQEVVRTMVANNYGFTIANVRPRNPAALDGRKLVAVKLAGDHKPMRIGISTLAQERKPMILTVFEEHCRNLITDTNIPGMTVGGENDA